MRPLRGRQGTFDKIIENIRRVAGKVPITIGGNFDESSADSYPALLDFLTRAGVRRPDREDQLQADHQAAEPATAEGVSSRSPSVGAQRQAVGRHVHDQRRRRASATVERRATPATSSTRRCRSCAMRRASAAFQRPTASTWARARFIGGTPTRSAPTARSTRAPASPATRRSPPATSTGARRCGGTRRPTASSALGAQGRVRRLFVHPGLRWRLLSGCAHRARRYASPSCHKSAFESALVSLAQRTAGVGFVNRPSAIQPEPE